MEIKYAILDDYAGFDGLNGLGAAASLLETEMKLLDFKVHDFGSKIGGSAKDRLRQGGGRGEKMSDEEKKIKAKRYLPTIEEAKGVGGDVRKAFKPEYEDFKAICDGNEALATLAYIYYYTDGAYLSVYLYANFLEWANSKEAKAETLAYLIERGNDAEFPQHYYVYLSEEDRRAAEFNYTTVMMAVFAIKARRKYEDFDIEIIKKIKAVERHGNYYCLYYSKAKNMDLAFDVFCIEYERALRGEPRIYIVEFMRGGVYATKAYKRSYRSDEYIKINSDSLSSDNYVECIKAGRAAWAEKEKWGEKDEFDYTDKQGLFAKVRKGEDYRKGKNAEPHDFLNTFGFRAVEFGESMPDKERWENMNRAYDSLMDLSKVLNLPTEAISMWGTLAISFGSRGRGGKNAPVAHYETLKKVINLTRKNGAGSLAHEWMHAVDNWLGNGSRFFSDWIPDSFIGSGYYYRAKKLDSLKGRKKYWSDRKEMFARAFEYYILNKLTDKGLVNEYLVQIPEPKKEQEDYYPYPIPKGCDFFDRPLDVEFRKAEEFFDELFIIKKSMQKKHENEM